MSARSLRITLAALSVAGLGIAQPVSRGAPPSTP
jgi:hypothetical protein